MERIVSGRVYNHFKNKPYRVIEANAEHTESGERMVVYKALYGEGKTYVRPYDMFASEVDHDKYPDVEQQYRFVEAPLYDIVGMSRYMKLSPDAKVRPGGVE